MPNSNKGRFGATLRGFRLGYCWYEPWKAMVRTRDALPSEKCDSIIELAPCEPDQIKSGGSKNYRNWYNPEDRKHLPEGVSCILELAQVGEEYHNPKRYIKLHMDYEGKVIKHSYDRKPKKDKKSKSVKTKSRTYYNNLADI